MGLRNCFKKIYKTPGFLGKVVLDNGEGKGAVMRNIEAWYEGDFYDVKEFFLHKVLRRKGVGSRLMYQLCQELKDRGVKTVWLITAKIVWQRIFLYKKRLFKSRKNDYDA
ncbi:MAG TPA: GNAT family N-acetyltransferase [Defluviitaleaceae bacterium]|nr:GNAT family N-acetyltransferase [Candidatus Epulonipiscium sp.]HOQ16010.1 GNAT family N-acetyltransferase [Defluviitaleaceae bacterium]HPT77239.1 GNAT family N-acetyltransferase [Defluviitaleaceae bacterium]HQD49678.1 GNAT family N-acetyltransferase [Defluviitaleaceae bacterium]